MIIEDVRVSLLRAPFVEKPGFFAHYQRDREILVVEVETRSGLVGLGYQLYLREGFRTTAACIEEVMAPRILGRDASEIEAIWRELWSANIADGRGGAQVFALSAIDVALWDIVGQRAGLPLHRLWGHYRSEVPAYGSGCWRGLGGEGMAEKACRFVEDGYRAVKMQVGHLWSEAEDVENVRLVREAVGSDVDVMVDVNMAWTADQAILMGRKFEPYEIYWLEEPVSPEDFCGYFRIAEALDTRVVGGESHFTRYDLRPFFENPGIPILQPDVIRGGLTELRKIAALADTWGMTIAPHLYPELMIHLLASIPNGLILEDMGLLDDLWVEWGEAGPRHRHRARDPRARPQGPARVHAGVPHRLTDPGRSGEAIRGSACGVHLRRLKPDRERNSVGLHQRRSMGVPSKTLSTDTRTQFSRSAWAASKRSHGSRCVHSRWAAYSAWSWVMANSSTALRRSAARSSCGGKFTRLRAALSSIS